MRVGVECRRIIPHCPRVIWHSHLEHERSCVDHRIGNLGLGGRRHHSALVSSLRQTRWRNFGTTMRPLAERAHTNLVLVAKPGFEASAGSAGFAYTLAAPSSVGGMLAGIICSARKRLSSAS